MADKPIPEPHDAIQSPETDDGQVKVTVSIGRDTLRRIDEIVAHAGFGGRARALDSVFETLEEVAGYMRTFLQNVDAASGTREDLEAFRGLILGATMAFTKLEKFYGISKKR